MICIYGVYKSIWMNFVGVSLWLDEAMLAFSFSTRNIWNLTSEVFEWDQIAPVGWLYINKIISSIFGNSEFTLRSFSVFSYSATLFLLYLISKKYLHLRLSALCPAYVASMSFALQYSIMFKPYISDGLFVMLSILAYLYYVKVNGRIVYLGIVWAILLWFSNPVCFVAGGIILSEITFAFVQCVGRGLKKNNFRLKIFLVEIKPWVLAGMILVISFVFYYFYWLRPVAIGAPMQDFWKGQNFPLFPKSADDLSKIRSMKSEIFSHFSYLSPIMILGLCSTLVFGIFEKNRLIVGLYLGLLLMLFASYINMFPVEDRMWYYFYPLASLLFFIGIDKLFHFENDGKGFVSLLAVGLFGIWAICGNTGFERYSTKESVFRSGEETNYEVEYVRDNINEDEKVYVYYHSIPGFMYKNGYDTYSIGDYDNNIIYGTGFLEKDGDYYEDILNIKNAHNCYIIMSHLWEERIYGIMHDLPQLGWLELVRNDYSTPLLFWTDDIGKTKSKVALSIQEVKETDEIVFVTIRIQNIGETILNSQFSRLQLASSEYGLAYDVPENIRQGEYVDVNLSYSAEYKPIFRLVDETGKIVCSEAEIEFER